MSEKMGVHIVAGSTAGDARVVAHPEARYCAAATGVRIKNEDKMWDTYTYVASGYGRSINEAIGAAIVALVTAGATDRVQYHWTLIQPLTDGAPTRQDVTDGSATI